MKRPNFTLLYVFILWLCFVSSPSWADRNDIPQQAGCLNEAKSSQALSKCLEEIFITMEGKRLILENAAKHKSFDSESTIDWNTFYAETLRNSRHFFEEYRKAECKRKEVLSSTGSKSKYEKLICKIRITKDRINALL